jgi:limonene-1,2-epoxide hydrolase
MFPALHTLETVANKGQIPVPIMTPQEIVRAFMAAVERRDVESAVAFLADDCEYDNVPMSKTFGPQAIGALLDAFLKPAKEVIWETLREAATGNIVFNERIDRFLFAHGWVEIPVTGVWEITDGKISLWRDYFDAGMWLKQQPS